MGQREYRVGRRAESVMVTPLDPPHGLKDCGRAGKARRQSCPSAIVSTTQNCQLILVQKEEPR